MIVIPGRASNDTNQCEGPGKPVFESENNNNHNNNNNNNFEKYHTCCYLLKPIKIITISLDKCCYCFPELQQQDIAASKAAAKWTASFRRIFLNTMSRTINVQFVAAPKQYCFEQYEVGICSHFSRFWQYLVA